MYANHFIYSTYIIIYVYTTHFNHSVDSDANFATICIFRIGGSVRPLERLGDPAEEDPEEEDRELLLLILLLLMLVLLGLSI